MAGLSVANLGRVGVLCGGLSPERPISLQSGEAVYRGLREAGVDAALIDIGENPIQQLTEAKIDRAFLILHGPGGEDGTIQGLLEAMNIPYTGSGVAASALAMDKYRTKLLWRGRGLPTARFELLHSNADWEEILSRLGGKVMVKPACEGSSLGMSSASSVSELEQAYINAVSHDTTVIAERWLEGREFTVPIIGGDVFPAIEITNDQEFYTYDAKYLSENTRYLCPAPVDGVVLEEMNRISLAAFETLGCENWGRVDLMMDESGLLMLLEANTAPGMTSHSLVPMSAAQAGLSFSDLVVRILKLSFENQIEASGQMEVLL